MATAVSTARHLRSVIAAALIGAGGAALAADPEAAAAPAPASAAPLDAVTTLIGDADCDNPGQCHVVGVGAKACGGPGAFRAWSSKTTDPAALAAAVDAQVRAQREENRRRGLVSDCSVVLEPAAVCRPRASDGKKTCQLGQGGVRSAI